MNGWLIAYLAVGGAFGAVFWWMAPDRWTVWALFLPIMAAIWPLAIVVIVYDEWENATGWFERSAHHRGDGG